MDAQLEHLRAAWLVKKLSYRRESIRRTVVAKRRLKGSTYPKEARQREFTNLGDFYVSDAAGSP